MNTAEEIARHGLRQRHEQAVRGCRNRRKYVCGYNAGDQRPGVRAVKQTQTHFRIPDRRHYTAECNAKDCHRDPRELDEPVVNPPRRTSFLRSSPCQVARDQLGLAEPEPKGCGCETKYHGKGGRQRTPWEDVKETWA